MQFLYPSGSNGLSAKSSVVAVAGETAYAALTAALAVSGAGKNTRTGLIVAVSDDDFVADFVSREMDKARTLTIKALLKDSDYQVLQKYLAGYKYDEIAQLLHISTKNVDNRLQAIKKILLKNKYKIIKGE